MDAKTRAFMARDLYRRNMVTRDQAREMVAEYEAVFNEKSRELAKKYNQRPKLFSFAGFMR